MKRLWEKPKLIVLVRGRAEEAVLFFCKSGQGNPTGAPYPNHQGCFTVECSPTCEAAQDT